MEEELISICNQMSTDIYGAYHSQKESLEGAIERCVKEYMAPIFVDANKWRNLTPDQHTAIAGCRTRADRFTDLLAPMEVGDKILINPTDYKSNTVRTNCSLYGTANGKKFHVSVSKVSSMIIITRTA